MGHIPDDSPGIPFERALDVLKGGKLIETHGLLPWGSNYTFLIGVSDGQFEVLAVYKPQRGERPLWDFPDGTLCKREVAAFVVSEALNWRLVPPTVLRDGSQGMGSLQLFVPHDPEQNYFTFEKTHLPQLARIALFDHIINNADRKGGHCLLDEAGNIWAIDHGVCFHTQPKLRTVIWDFAGEKIPDELLVDVGQLCETLEDGALVDQLKPLLSADEINALRVRTAQLSQTGTFPEPGPGRSYPWPPV
jgi:uncharacterized repeat protein (TIGR03843 family)